MRIKNLKHQYLGENKHYLYIGDVRESSFSYRQNNICMHCESYLQPDGDQSYYKSYEYWATLHGQERVWMPFCSERCYKEYPKKSEFFSIVDEFVARHGKEKYEKKQKEEERQRNRERAEYERAQKAQERAAKAELEENLKIESKRKKVRYALYFLLLCYIIYTCID